MATLLGPILQLRGIEGGDYNISAMVVQNAADPDPISAITLSSGARITRCINIAKIPFESPTLSVWRIDIAVPMAQAAICCTYKITGVQGCFWVPKINTAPQMAYASCNGFSNPKLMKQVDRKYDRWEHLASKHKVSPYNLLLLGGDQVYSDEIWKSVKALEEWTDLPIGQRVTAVWTKSLNDAVDAFFCNLYLTRWTQPEVHGVLQAIPSIMMWDDHDIFDGWGSYPAALHNCPVYQGLFKVATNYFHALQQQLAVGERHPSVLQNQTAYTVGFRNMGNVALLVMDLRFERKPEPEQIVSPLNWDAIFAWLEAEETPGHLVVMSSIPVAYLDLNLIENLLGILPGQPELEDDLRDHWRSTPHMQERLRLIHRLFKYSESKRRRITILSGDVHVGAACAIESSRSQNAGNANVMNQLISTGIVHPAPPSLVRYVLESIGGKPETVDRGISATMLPIAGKGRYLIGARNWLALEPDESGRLWANWHVEGAEHPITKVIHACDKV